MDTSRITDYVLDNKSHRAVTGWLNEGAISTVIAFAKWQEDNHVFGDVAEIGVHHGKFFILLANLRREGERAFAVDVFDDQHLNPDRSGCGDLARFADNLGLYADRADVEILKKDSTQLTRGDFYRGRKGGIRLFSVDGSHTATHTLSDLTIASQLLSRDGIICLDDFYNPEWPGVQEGFYRFLTSSSDVVPFAYGNHKLYLCKTETHSRNLHLVEDDLRPFLVRYKRVEIGSSPVAYISLPAPESVFGHDLRLMPNVFSLREQMISPRLTFGTGWATPQANGVWTVGPRSNLQLVLQQETYQAPALSIEAEPFLHQTRPSRRLSIRLNDRNLGDFVCDKTTPKTLELPVPLKLFEYGCDLQFDIEKPDRPSETIGTRDARPLGFFFRQIRIIERAVGSEQTAPRIS
jgi:methyltransferase family protein